MSKFIDRERLHGTTFLKGQIEHTMVSTLPLGLPVCSLYHRAVCKPVHFFLVWGGNIVCSLS
jgi:hypothetical protein